MNWNRFALLSALTVTACRPQPPSLTPQQVADIAKVVAAHQADLAQMSPAFQRRVRVYVETHCRVEAERIVCR